jgi:subtilisin family serine protease
MKTLITCNTPDETNYVYDLLNDSNKGENCLKGRKKYLDDHTQVPTIMSFDLNQEEIEELKKLPQVKSVKKLSNIPTPILHDISVVKQECSFKQAIPDPTSAIEDNPFIAPHSLFYSQTSEVIANQEVPLADGSGNVMLNFVDCSNIDIIVVDSGIDSSHPDFLNQSTGETRVVDFDWGVFSELDPNSELNEEIPIIPDFNSHPTKRIDFIQDTDGHGTGCASLAAGNRCGTAKNASLYSMKIFGPNCVTPLQAMKCVLAFIKAKANNEHGLVSTRPTVITNSWGYNRIPILPIEFIENCIDETYDTLLRFTGANLNRGGVPPGFAGSVGSPEVFDVDSYVREIIENGGHFLRAAGNENSCVDNTDSSLLLYHVIWDSSVGSYALIPSNETTDEFFSSYQIGDAIFNSNIHSDYTIFSYYGVEVIGFYASPHVGIAEDKSGIITVGDVSPVGTQIDSSHNSWSTVAAVEPFLEGADERVIIDLSVRYRTHDGNKFIKSFYSNFGPDVDIYATGNATFAAKSSMCPSFIKTFAKISDEEQYRYFNGTSAATPIVAGILASFLAENPIASPAEAKQWLIDNSSKGNIMKTAVEQSTRGMKNLFDVEVPVNCPLVNRERSEGHFFYFNDNQNRENFLLNARFTDEGIFGGHNRIAQLYPLRDAILETQEPTISICNTELTLVQTDLISPKTHDI